MRKIKFRANWKLSIVYLWSGNALSNRGKKNSAWNLSAGWANQLIHSRTTLSVRHPQSWRIMAFVWSSTTVSFSLLDWQWFETISSSLVEILRGPYWLNDQIIAFYCQYLESKKYFEYSKQFAFISPQVTQLLKLSSKEDCRVFLDPLRPYDKNIVFFTVNDNNSPRAGGMHWSLLVYSRIEEKFFSFDSSKNINRLATQKIVQVLQTGMQCPEADLELVNCSQQVNSYDCGIHVLANIENIANHFLSEGTVRNVPALRMSAVVNKRQELLTLIEELEKNSDDKF